MTQVNSAWERTCRFFDENIQFLELHYLFILMLILVLSGLFYCQPGTELAYIDALFMATTSATDTGLNTVNLSDFSTWQNVVLVFGMMLGSSITMSFIILAVRKYYFSKRFKDVLLFNDVQHKREEQSRKLHMQTADIESKGQVVSTFPLPRQLSFSSTQSCPSGQENKYPRERRQQQLSEQPTNAATTTKDVLALVTHCRALQQERFDSEEASIEKLGLSKKRSTLNIELTTTEDLIDQDLRCATIGTDLSDTTEHMKPSRALQAVAFVNAIDHQREMARNRYLKVRKLEELFAQIANCTDPPREIDQLGSNKSMTQTTEKNQLTRQERFRMGGVEYRAINLLMRIVPCYFVGMIVIPALFYRLYFAASSYAQQIITTSNYNGPVNTWFLSFFLSVSSFNNVGLSLLDANMVPFQNAPAPLLLSAFQILAGNTAYAIFLRFIIWVLWKLTPKSHTLRCETLRYLLDYPRRCYTTLFPSTQTWWLLFVLVALTLAETVSFVALNYWLPVLDGITSGGRLLDGVFQAVATRSAGFNVVSLGNLNPATLLVYIVAMYISAYPVTISMRNSNVYQERALGIFRHESEKPISFSEKELSGPAPFIRLRRHSTINSVLTTSKKFLRGPDFFVITQIQRQLTSDISWVIVGIFCICVLEYQEIMSPSPITVATVIYECVSAFGNIGNSTGYPNTTTAQSAQYRTLSKIVLIILMYRGRHRGNYLIFLDLQAMYR